MSKPLIPAQRRERIQEYMTIHQIARSTDLCNLLGASEATVRRDGGAGAHAWGRDSKSALDI